MLYVAYVLFCFGCFVCLFNFHLSFLRYPLYRLRGGSPEEYRWSSVAPMMGSLLVVLFVLCVGGTPWMFWFGVVCAALDTGGLHWFAGTLLYMSIRRDR